MKHPECRNPSCSYFPACRNYWRKISPASRAVSNLHYLPDLPIQEVAAILEIRCWNCAVARRLWAVVSSTNCERKGKTMTHTVTDVLRKSLDRVGRERKRARLLLFALLA